MDAVERALLKAMEELTEWDRNDLVQKLASALADYRIRKRGARR